MKIGITEAGDPSINYEWINKVNNVDGIILITKNITDKFIEEILKVKDKTILHCSCTGYGGATQYYIETPNKNWCNKVN